MDSMMKKINFIYISVALFYLCSIIQQINTSGSNMKIVCYYRYQGNESNRLTPDKLDVELCTHILIGFAGVYDSVVSYDEKDIPGYRWTASLKDKNPNLKVMLSLGGGDGFSKAVSSKNNRTRFIESIFKICRENNLDGIDIDWEFPVWKSTFISRNKSDKPNLILFLKEFKIATEQKYPENPLLISIAVAGPKTIIDAAYDIPMISKYADFINLMSYDYNDYHWYTPFLAHNAPLFARKSDIGYFSTLNTEWSANYYVNNGMNKSKLMVGLALYAHTYKLSVKSQHDPGSLAAGSGISGGGLAYPDVCEFLKNGGTRKFDNEAKVPYAFKNFDWISYDDYESVEIKSNWTKENGFGGVMTFSLNTDDWNGICDGKTTFPLMKIIKKIIHG